MTAARSMLEVRFSKVRAVILRLLFFDLASDEALQIAGSQFQWRVPGLTG
jgi:hypothetical protein